MAPLTRYMGMKPEEVLKMCVNSMVEVDSRKVHAYTILYHVVGRKLE